MSTIILVGKHTNTHTCFLCPLPLSISASVCCFMGGGSGGEGGEGVFMPPTNLFLI